MAHPNIEFRTNTVVDEVLGVEEKEVKGLKLRDVVTGATSTLNVDGMFLGIGHEPNAKMFAGQIDLDEEGYVLTQGNVLHDAQGNRGAGRVCVRRCAGPALSAGDYGGGNRMHGGA